MFVRFYETIFYESGFPYPYLFLEFRGDEPLGSLSNRFLANRLVICT